MKDHNTMYIRNPDFIFRKIVGEMILVPIHADVADLNCLYTLNDVGAFLWERLSEPSSFSDLTQAVLENYEISLDQASEDIKAFIQELLSLQALTEVQE